MTKLYVALTLPPDLSVEYNGDIFILQFVPSILVGPSKLAMFTLFEINTSQ